MQRAYAGRYPAWINGCPIRRMLTLYPDLDIRDALDHYRIAHDWEAVGDDWIITIRDGIDAGLTFTD